MSEFSNYLEGKLLDHVLKNTTYTSPTTVYVGLFTTNPTDAGTGTEVTGGSYARQAATFGAASGGSSTTTADITFPQATADWGVVSHIGIYDNVSAGNFLMYTPLDSSKTVSNGDILKINTGNLTVTLD